MRISGDSVNNDSDSYDSVSPDPARSTGARLPEYRSRRQAEVGAVAAVARLTVAVCHLNMQCCQDNIYSRQCNSCVDNIKITFSLVSKINGFLFNNVIYGS